uniref:C2H2-type domain-containing protein n=1 Tax=Daphnia galeata TaxID=27404 RepID=A0A8J2RV92_9CRUS|nr:unnamed protein product [Daphnia galeata]
MIKHDPKLMTIKESEDDGSATNDLPTLTNGHIESKMPELNGELSTLDFQWLTLENDSVYCNPSQRVLPTDVSDPLEMESLDHTVEIEQVFCFKCPKCEYVSLFKEAVEDHLKKEHQFGIVNALEETTTESSDFLLNDCDLEPNQTSDDETVHAEQGKKVLKFHVNTHSDQPTCLCDECGKGFKNMKQLRNHNLELHSVNKGSSEQQLKNKCPDCGQVLSSSRLLRARRNAVHLKMRSHLCNYCGYNTTSQSNLRIHLRRQTEEKPFACDSCDYRTSDHNPLRRHKMKHTGEKQYYKCPHCSYASTYKAHLRNKPLGLSDELIFSCPLCNFRTIRKEQLNLHVTSAHNESGNGSSEKTLSTQLAV